VLEGDDPVRVDLSDVPKAISDQLNLPEKFSARFELPVTDGEFFLNRSHPSVEALASHVLTAALDSHLEGPARRCGVIRTGRVAKRTTLLLLRHRFHIVTKIGEVDRPLLAEDSQIVAFTGATQNPEWLSSEASELLLGAVPDANVAPEQARSILSKVINEIGHIFSKLTKIAQARGDELLEAHTRVRQAIRAKGVRHRVEAQETPDVLGVFVYLPKV
jgi:hypothetical protein